MWVHLRCSRKAGEVVIRRYLIGFMCMLAGLVASPLSASAQDAEEGATSEPNLQESVSEPAPEEPGPQVPDIDTLSQLIVNSNAHFGLRESRRKN